MVAGHKEAVQEVCSKLKEMKIRSITLKVSVPSHTKLMVPAQKKLQRSSIVLIWECLTLKSFNIITMLKVKTQQIFKKLFKILLVK